MWRAELLLLVFDGALTPQEVAQLFYQTKEKAHDIAKAAHERQFQIRANLPLLTEASKEIFELNNPSKWLQRHMAGDKAARPNDESSDPPAVAWPAAGLG